MATPLESDPYLAVDRPLPPVGDDRLRALLAWAILAPSPHNTQPWAWAVADDVIELRADTSRLLTVSDPDGRELVIGCGAALEHLLLRLGMDGMPLTVETLPEGWGGIGEGAVLARVHTGAGEPYEHRPDLVAAMSTRRTNRNAYRDEPMDPGLRSTLTRAAAEFGVESMWLQDAPHREALVALIMDADRRQMSSAEFRRELAHWMRPKHSSSDDGMQADLLGQRGIAAYLAPLAVRTFDMGKMQAARDGELASGSPDLVVIWTPTDDAGGWLATGRALARLTLEAQAAGRASAYMNQPCEVPVVRGQLAKSLGISGHPQLVLRFGLAEQVHPADRMPVSRVLRQ
ncbi:MAG: nitroreductase family protein [Mycobacterium sp.]|nr:nitroreductase family protein [Mycobacterium sp.]